MSSFLKICNILSITSILVIFTSFIYSVGSVWEAILRSLHIISKKLQNVDMNVEGALKMLQNFLNSIQTMRNNYNDILLNAKSLCLIIMGN